MYKLKGYIVEDNIGNVINYSTNQVTATNVAQQNGLSTNNVMQVYVHKTPVFDMTTPEVIDLYEPNAHGMLVKAKQETNEIIKQES